MGDAINPDHYKSSKSGIECIEVTQFLDFCMGNAVKYLWRAGLKNDLVEDYKKAEWYFNREFTSWANYSLIPEKALSAVDKEEWVDKFQNHVDTIEDYNIRRCLAFCLASVTSDMPAMNLAHAIIALRQGIAEAEKDS